MVVAAFMVPALIFALLFAGTGWERARDAVPRTSLPDQPRLKLIGARGDEVRFMINGSVLGKARWRSSTGVTLELEGERIQVVKPRKKDWGDAITVGNGPLAGGPSERPLAPSSCSSQTRC